MAYSSWSVVFGEQPSAAKWNILGTNGAYFDSLIGSGTAWTAYTPSWTTDGTAPAIGNGTLTGRYQQFGKTIFCAIEWVAGSTTTFGTFAYHFSLPITAKTPGVTNKFVGVCYGVRQSTANIQLIFNISSATPTKVDLYYNSAAAVAGQVTNTAPYTWANTDIFAGYFTYEAA